MTHALRHVAQRYVKSLYLGAQEGRPSDDSYACNPASAIATTVAYSPALAFDPNTDQGAVFELLIPEDRCPGTEMTAKLVWTTVLHQGGNVRWVLAYQPGKYWSYLYPSPAPVWPTIRHGGGVTSFGAFAPYYQNVTRGILIKSEDLDGYENLQILVARHASAVEDVCTLNAYLLKLVIEYEAWSGLTYTPQGE